MLISTVSPAVIAYPRTVRMLASILPSPDHPFIFFHIARTGGTTLRKQLVAAARRLHLTHAVPCYILHCMCKAHRLPNSKNYCGLNQSLTFANAAVLGGHFDPADLRFWNVSVGRSTCFTVLRDPVERLISVYAEFGLASRYEGRVFHNLTLPEMVRLQHNFAYDYAKAAAWGILDSCFVALFELREV